MSNVSLPAVFDADTRYGSTFLDINNQEQAVRGEIMQDPLTAEIYLKRVIDGKIISFAQKATTIYEAIKEFNIQYQSSEGFIFPTDPGSFLLGVRFDVDEYTDPERKRDIFKTNIQFNASKEEKAFRIEISPECNGFFIKPSIRPGDRNATAYLCGKFSVDETIDFGANENTMEEWMDLSPLYSSPYDYTTWHNMNRWDSSAALVDYAVKTTGLAQGGETIEVNTTKTVPIRLSEYNYLPLPLDYDDGIVTILTVEISVNKIYFPKLQYERELESRPGTTHGITEQLERVIESDIRAVLNSVDMFYFINNPSQIPLNNNFTINQLVDIHTLLQSIDDLSNSTGTRAVQVSVSRPIAWQIDTMWCETTKALGGNGEFNPTSSEPKIKEIEEILYRKGDNYLEYVTDQWNLENIWVSDLSKG